MATLRSDDLRRIVGLLPKDVLEIIKTEQVFLAGGYIRARVAGEIVSDIDLLVGSDKKAGELADKLCASRGDKKPWRTKNAFTITETGKTPVQFIKRWTFNEPQALIDSFDFTIAQACVWFDGTQWKSLTSEHFYPDLASKRLRYTFPIRHEDAGGSILRVQKFIKRGYDIAPEELAKVIARLLSGVDNGSKFWESGEEAKAKVITSLLRHVDPLTIIDGIPADDCLESPPQPENFGETP